MEANGVKIAEELKYRKELALFLAAKAEENLIKAGVPYNVIDDGSMIALEIFPGGQSRLSQIAQEIMTTYRKAWTITTDDDSVGYCRRLFVGLVWAQ